MRFVIPGRQAGLGTPGATPILLSADHWLAAAQTVHQYTLRRADGITEQPQALPAADIEDIAHDR